MQIRKRDGTMAEVSDDYVLRDGETMRVALRFMDAKGGMIHDGNGHPAGQRPGFLINDDERAAQAVADSYKEYDAALGERWRQGPDQRSARPSSAPRTFDSAEAARADAYRTYDEAISNRWRSK